MRVIYIVIKWYIEVCERAIGFSVDNRGKPNKTTTLLDMNRTYTICVYALYCEWIQSVREHVYENVCESRAEWLWQLAGVNLENHRVGIALLGMLSRTEIRENRFTAHITTSRPSWKHIHTFT